jgi:hypothetical protein
VIVLAMTWEMAIVLIERMPGTLTCESGDASRKLRVNSPS